LLGDEEKLGELGRRIIGLIEFNQKELSLTRHNILFDLLEHHSNTITMMFRSTILATLVATAAATAAASSVIPDFDISANSKLGKKLMSKARALEQNGEQDTTWMANYSIKYMGCSSIIQINGGEGGGGGGDESMLYQQNLVKFALCPSEDACSSCNTGVAQYVVNMMEFIDAYTEMKMSEQETKCEYIREYCYCDNRDDDEGCENQCYADAGMSQCIEYEGDEEFEIQQYLECDGKSFDCKMRCTTCVRLVLIHSVLCFCSDGGRRWR
jgi:hypothetical protein